MFNKKILLTITLVVLVSCSKDSNDKLLASVPSIIGNEKTDDPRFSYATLKDNATLNNAVSTFSENLSYSVRSQQIVGGEILLMQNGKVILHQATGWEDKEAEKDLGLNQLFYIEDLNSLFLTAGILILAESGQVDLCQPVAKYLPAFNSGKSKSITIEQLMRNTSGITHKSYKKNREEYDNYYQAIEEIALQGPDVDPGTVQSPNHINTDILTAVIEAASGNTLDEFFSVSLFNELGLENTFLDISQQAELLDKAIARYNKLDNGNLIKKWDNHQAVDPMTTWPRNAAYSTITDYAVFLSMWINNGRHLEKQILSENILKYQQKTLYQPVNENKPDECLFAELAQSNEIITGIKPSYLATDSGPTVFASESNQLLGLFFTQTTWNKPNYIFWQDMGKLDSDLDWN